MPDLLDVVGMGNALVDVLASVDEDIIVQSGLAKGATQLVDLPTAEVLYARLGATTEMSGGSAANTMVGVAALGGSAGYVGKVAADALGDSFTKAIRATGVEYHPIVAERTQADAPGTGHCVVLVTCDADRTMATYLGAATTIGPDDLPTELVARGRLLYLEGYLWDVPPAKEAMRRAIAISHANDGSVALSLSDPFCVDRHRREFLELLLDDVDIVFGNEQEITELFAASSFDGAISAAEETGLLIAVTRGAEGSVVLGAHGPETVPAAEVERVIDTTGAGDLFAAGFLYGLTHGAGPITCARLGSLCAAEIISHFGARPEGDLGKFLAEVDL
jgi:sugar/nucleoside kinase (ribokinase family)